MDLTIPCQWAAVGGRPAWKPGLSAPAPPSAPVLGPTLGGCSSLYSLPWGGVYFPKPQIQAKLQEAPGALLTGHVCPTSGEQAPWGSGPA